MLYNLEIYMISIRFRYSINFVFHPLGEMALNFSKQVSKLANSFFRNIYPSILSYLRSRYEWRICFSWTKHKIDGMPVDILITQDYLDFPD